MPLITRRRLFILVGGAALFSGIRFGHARLARPAKPDGPLSDAARELIAKAWQGLDPARVLDTHVHVVGVGAGGTGCRVGERMQSPLNPGEYLKFSIYLEAAGITDMTRADQQYLERIEALLRAQAPHGRLLLLAFDQAYDEAGQVLEDATEFYTPNEYVLGLAKARTGPLRALRVGAPVPHRRARGARARRGGRRGGGEVAAQRDEHRPVQRALRRLLRGDGAAARAAHHPCGRREGRARRGSAAPRQSAAPAPAAVEGRHRRRRPLRVAGEEPGPRRPRAAAVAGQLRALRAPHEGAPVAGQAVRRAVRARAGEPPRAGRSRPC